MILVEVEVRLFSFVAGGLQFLMASRSRYFWIASVPGRWGLELQRTLQPFIALMCAQRLNRFL